MKAHAATIQKTIIKRHPDVVTFTITGDNLHVQANHCALFRDGKTLGRVLSFTQFTPNVYQAEIRKFTGEPRLDKIGAPGSTVVFYPVAKPV